MIEPDILIVSIRMEQKATLAWQVEVSSTDFDDNRQDLELCRKRDSGL